MSNAKFKTPTHINEEIKYEYFQWLCNLVGCDNHLTLFRHLHRRPFIWTILNDDNRAMDGKTLRDRFMYDMCYSDYDLPDDDCSVLEMLVGVANRMNDLVIPIEEVDQTSMWFWEILGNLQLDLFTDDEFFEHGGIAGIDRILDVFLVREYRRNGEGGLFPLKNPKKDQRKVEIWYQMCAYLVENEHIEDEF